MEPDRSAVDESEIRAQLDRLLAVESVSASTQLTAFLRYIVEQTLSGNSSGIKAYTVAVDALERPTSFDPQSDPLVRVLATRLRQALDLYYATDGKDDPIRIGLPKGGYVPTFETRVEPKARNATPPTRWHNNRLPVQNAKAAWWATAIAAALIVQLGILAIAYSMFIADTKVPPPNTLTGERGIPIIVVGPFTATPPTTRDIQLAQGIRRQFIADLSHFKNLRVRDVALAKATIGFQNAVKNASYRIEGTLFEYGDALNLTINVTDILEGNLIWSDSITATNDDAGFRNLMLSSVRKVVTRLASTSGLLQAEAMKRLEKRSLNDGNLGTSGYDCVVLFNAYELLRRPKHEVQAHNCLNNLVSKNTQDSAVWAAHGLMQFFEWTRSKVDGDDSALDRALNSAETAIRLDPTDSFGYEVKGYVTMNQGHRSLAAEMLNRAMNLNPSKPDLPILIGWNLILGGDWERGLASVRTGLEMSPAPPGWFRIPLAADAFRRDDFVTALAEAEEIIHTGDTHGYILAIPPAHRLGETRKLAHYIKQFKADPHANLANPLREIRRLFNSPEIIKKYADGAKAAGLGED